VSYNLRARASISIGLAKAAVARAKARRENFMMGTKEGIVSKRAASSFLSSEDSSDRYRPSLVSIHRVYFGLEQVAI
jgi:hypothetical protein